jgi:hypothetical protein
MAFTSNEPGPGRGAVHQRGDCVSGAIGSIGDSVTLLAVLWLPAAWLVWRHLPETRGLDLDLLP